MPNNNQSYYEQIMDAIGSGVPFLRYYAAESACTQDYNGEEYFEPWISFSDDTETVRYNKSEYEKMLAVPLTFEITGDGDIMWKARLNDGTRDGVRTIEYKKNDGQWTSITSDSGVAAPTISVSSGDTVQFRGNNVTYGKDLNNDSCFSGTTCQFKVKGNIMSLLNPTGFSGMTELASSFTFTMMFRACTGLTDASKLVLPATTLSVRCYSYMFSMCSNLTKSPKLAIVSGSFPSQCYHSMFINCTSLVEAPSVLGTSATTTENNCCGAMFQGCTSLEKSPKIMPSTIGINAYEMMFSGCTSLRYIFCLATGNSSNCGNWVSGVNSDGIFVKGVNVSVSTWNRGINGIPTNWGIISA